MLKKYGASLFVVVLIFASGISTGSIIVKNTERPTDITQSQSAMGTPTLHPPWYGHDSWFNKWTEIFGTSEGTVETNPNNGTMNMFVTTRFFGKAQADGHFQHQTNYDEFVAPSTGKYNVRFIYSYDGLINVYLMRWGGRWDSWLDAEIKVTFIAHEKGSTNSYTGEKTILYEEYRGTYIEEPTELGGSFLFDLKNIDLTGGKGVCFTAKVDAVLFIRSGGFCGRVHGLLDFEGTLNRIEIEKASGQETNPTIQITKPTEKSLYINNKYILPYPKSLILGDIKIIADTTDTSYVEFYIDDVLKYTDETEEDGKYSWMWSESATIPNYHTIKVIAYGNSGLKSEDSVRVIYWNKNA